MMVFDLAKHVGVMACLLLPTIEQQAYVSKSGKLKCKSIDGCECVVGVFGLASASEPSMVNPKSVCECASVCITCECDLIELVHNKGSYHQHKLQGR
jgi:hypothetical protein